ncbi:phage tail tape measure protein [Radiobacillus sp. PE A8.2]|uniref:phage tail tape measure protein n=1 Tax=Radiobacillus sp. PE A8.2 TaxID=3380349 RepID=UPI00388FA13B
MPEVDLGNYGAEIYLDDSNFNSTMDNADSRMKKTESKMGSFAKGLGGIAAGAVVGLGTALLGASIAGTKMADDLDKALNGLQASTGSTDDEMKGMEDSLKNIYNANYGESFDDIAQSMASVKQNTNLTGDALEDATKNAIMLRDTFEFDVNESANTANSLMKQFGISSEEAYNLMAQGAQNGANKNGDMLEVLSEYAPQYKALGFSAEEFTNTLIDGAENGAFQIDKVGDAIKEFNIRSKDGSKTSAEGFQTLGLNAEEMTSQFAQGGETAQQAFQQVVTALNGIEDPVEKNAAGVALFGTQFEDLESGAIAAFANIGDKADLSKDALSEIDQVKYDSFGEAMQGIGRNFQTALIEPMQKYVLPLLSEFSQYIFDNMPQIQQTMKTVFDAIGIAISTTITWVGNLVNWLKTWFQNNQDTINGIKAGFQDFVTVVVNLVKGFVDLATKIWEKYGDTILKYAKKTFDNIKLVISGVLDVIKGIIKTVTGIITGDWDKAWEGIKQIFSGVWKAIEGIVKQALNYLKTVITIAFDAIKSYISGAWNKTKDIIANVADSIWSTVKKRFNTMKDTIAVIFEAIKTTAGNIFDKIKSAITSPIDKAVSTVKTLIGKIKDALNFNWSLPKLKMPHVSVDMKKKFGIPYPDFDISWYKNGGIFDKPTLAGLGEAGKEAIVPLIGRQMDPFADAVYKRIADNLSSNRTTNNESQTTNHSNTFHINIDGFDGSENDAKDFAKELKKEFKGLGVSFN